jgi:hypothetical protein
VRTVFLDLPSELGPMTFSSLERAHMMKEGYVTICSPQTSWLDPNSKFQGPLLLLEEGTETASTSLESKLLCLDWAIKGLSSICSITMKACLAEAFAARKLKLLNLLGAKRTRRRGGLPQPSRPHKTGPVPRQHDYLRPYNSCRDQRSHHLLQPKPK